MRKFVNKIPGYYESNAVMYMKNSENRGLEVRWKTCENYHVLSWRPDLRESEPDSSRCEKCLIENKCGCDGVDLLRYGCQCGGR